jgi:hypothetical protein
LTGSKNAQRFRPGKQRFLYPASLRSGPATTSGATEPCSIPPGQLRPGVLYSAEHPFPAQQVTHGASQPGSIRAEHQSAQISREEDRARLARKQQRKQEQNLLQLWLGKNDGHGQIPPARFGLHEPKGPFQDQSLKLLPEVTWLEFSSPDPHSVSSPLLRNKKTLLHEVISSQLFSFEKSFVTTVNSAFANLESRIEMKINDIFTKKIKVPLSEKNASHKLADEAAEILLAKLDESTIGKNLVKEMKRSIIIQIEMFQVKNQYIKDDLVDLGNKLGEQMASI